MLTWYGTGPWKRIVASREFYRHEFPAPHIDAVESFIDYRVPPDKFGPLAEFDGSVVVERTAGEVSARCHDEEANFLALNLDYRRGKPTPYMEKLRFKPGSGGTADPDHRVLSDDDLERAKREGKEAGASAGR
jgi:hypothetical protein